VASGRAGGKRIRNAQRVGGLAHQPARLEAALIPVTPAAMTPSAALLWQFLGQGFMAGPWASAVVIRRLGTGLAALGGFLLLGEEPSGMVTAGWPRRSCWPVGRRRA
jgi:hypothetical protein